MILEQPCPLVVNTKKLFLLSIFSALRAKLSVPAALVLFGILSVRCCQRYCVVTSEFALHFGTCKKKKFMVGHFSEPLSARVLSV